MEYLYSQTGKVLHYITDDTKEPSVGPLSDLNQGQEADEGFVDADDQTVAPVETILAVQQADSGKQLAKDLIIKHQAILTLELIFSNNFLHRYCFILFELLLSLRSIFLYNLRLIKQNWDSKVKLFFF